MQRSDVSFPFNDRMDRMFAVDTRIGLAIFRLPRGKTVWPGPSRWASPLRAGRADRRRAMADTSTPVSELRARMRAFIADREWEQFHSPKNLAMALAAEAAELMEHFLWVDGPESKAMLADPVKR